jgi:hypothetical protein
MDVSKNPLELLTDRTFPIGFILVSAIEFPIGALFARVRATGDETMTCRIDRVGIEGSVVLRLSGRITGDALDVLRTALEESRVVAIDLAEIELVDRDAVIVLAAGESSGIELRRCPAFIREWITRERDPE